MGLFSGPSGHRGVCHACDIAATEFCAGFARCVPPGAAFRVRILRPRATLWAVPGRAPPGAAPPLAVPAGVHTGPDRRPAFAAASARRGAGLRGAGASGAIYAARRWRAERRIRGRAAPVTASPERPQIAARPGFLQKGRMRVPALAPTSPPARRSRRPPEPTETARLCSTFGGRRRFGSPPPRGSAAIRRATLAQAASR